MSDIFVFIKHFWLCAAMVSPWRSGVRKALKDPEQSMSKIRPPALKHQKPWVEDLSPGFKDIFPWVNI